MRGPRSGRTAAPLAYACASVRGPLGRHSESSVQPSILEALPTVLRTGPYRLFFYSADRDEPLHVHVERDDSAAKFWLAPLRLEWSRGFTRVELRRIEALVRENGAILVRAWHEHFGN